MLLWLSIQGLALVDSIELEFAPALNVLTGETGAGKSLILGSIGLLLGERADPTWLRAGETRGSVEATFDLTGRPELIEALGGLEVEVEEERLLVRREIASDGKTRAFVNGRSVLLAQLRAVGDLLVDLHGQHEHQQLLRVDRQTDFFDHWAGTWSERSALEAERAAILEERARVQAARSAHERDQAEEETLRADLAELEESALDPEEERSLLRERERLAHKERLLACLSEALSALTDEDHGAELRLLQGLKSVRAAAALDPGLAPLAEETAVVSDSLSSLGARLSGERDRLLEEPLDLDQVEARLDRIHRLKRKHKRDLPSLAELREELRGRVRSLDPGSGELARMERALTERLSAYEAKVASLIDRRSVQAPAFARAAGTLLSGLGFGRAALTVAMVEGSRARPAIDPAPIPALEFGFQPNTGEAPRPLRRIASGGELSRVMLAIKSLMAERDQVAVLVFDEVDQGIGGAVGEEVGRLLRKLGERRQVLCVTHLPLIAAYAGRQFQVSKAARKGRATTTVEPLDEEARVTEIARLLAGARVTNTTVRQARELLHAAQSGTAGSLRRAALDEEPPSRSRRIAKGKG